MSNFYDIEKSTTLTLNISPFFFKIIARNIGGSNHRTSRWISLLWWELPVDLEDWDIYHTHKTVISNAFGKLRGHPDFCQARIIIKRNDR